MSTNDNLNFDSFSQISPKLGFLFRAVQDAAVLLIGHHALKWGEDFKNYFSFCDETEVFTSDKAKKLKKNNRMYDFIIFDASISQQTDIEETLSDLREHLSSNGHLMLIAGNKYSLNKIKTFLNDGVAGSLGLSLNRYKKALRKSGFTSIRAFLPMPSINDMEEIVSEHIKTVELPVYYHPIYKIAARCKFYKHIHDGFIFISSPASEDGISYFLERFQSKLKSVTRRTYKFSLDRFYMRGRGALVLFLSDSLNKKKYIVRIAVTQEIDLKIRENESWIQQLLHDEKVLKEVKNKLPHPVANFQYTNNKVYVEEMIEGVIAWKLSRKPVLKKKIDEEAASFLWHLDKSTRKYLDVDERIFRSLFEEDIKRLTPLTSGSEDIRHAIQEMLAFLRDGMLGQKYPFVLSHGDYGYGNIIAHPQTGKISGIIDWDGARNLDLPGLDLLHLLIQSLRQDYSLSEAFKSVITDILEKQELIHDNLKQFYPDMNEKYMRILIVTLGIRFIASEVQYPASIVRHGVEFSSILVWIKNTVVPNFSLEVS